MTPITQTVQGTSYTFTLPLASLNSILTADALAQAFRVNSCSVDDAMHRANWKASTGQQLQSVPTSSNWANAVAGSSLRMPVEQIRAVLAAALVGGGMASATATDTAERIVSNQMNRDVDALCATITTACIAAG